MKEFVDLILTKVKASQIIINHIIENAQKVTTPDGDGYFYKGNRVMVKQDQQGDIPGKYVDITDKPTMVTEILLARYDYFYIGSKPAIIELSKMYPEETIVITERDTEIDVMIPTFTYKGGEVQSEDMDFNLCLHFEASKEITQKVVDVAKRLLKTLFNEELFSVTRITYEYNPDPKNLLVYSFKLIKDLPGICIKAYMHGEEVETVEKYEFPL